MKRLKFLLFSLLLMAFSCDPVFCPAAIIGDQSPGTSVHLQYADLSPAITATPDQAAPATAAPAATTQTADPKSMLPANAPEVDKSGFMGKGWKWLIFWLMTLLMTVGNILPTGQAENILQQILKVLSYIWSAIIPNLKEGGGVHSWNIFVSLFNMITGKSS